MMLAFVRMYVMCFVVLGIFMLLVFLAFNIFNRNGKCVFKQVASVGVCDGVDCNVVYIDGALDSRTLPTVGEVVEICKGKK